MRRILTVSSLALALVLAILTTVDARTVAPPPDVPVTPIVVVGE